MSKYSIQIAGTERAIFEGDFSNASSPIFLNGNSTPFQVADSSHSPRKMAEKLNRWCFSEGGEIWGENEEFEIVETP